LFQAAGDVGEEERFVEDLQNRVQMQIPAPLGMISMGNAFVGQVVEYL